MTVTVYELVIFSCSVEIDALLRDVMQQKSRTSIEYGNNKTRLCKLENDR